MSDIQVFYGVGLEEVDDGGWDDGREMVVLYADHIAFLENERTRDITVKAALYAQVYIAIVAATLTAERDAARDIAVRLEGELGQIHSAIEAAIESCEPDADFVAVRAVWRILGDALDDPDAVIAEGES